MLTGEKIERVFDLVVSAAKEVSGIPLACLIGNGREQRVCDARFLCFAVLREHGLTFEEIGRLFHRNHGTVVHGINKLNDMLATEERVRADLQRVRELAGLASPLPGQPGLAAEELLRELVEGPDEAIPSVLERARKFLAGRNVA